MNNINRQPFLNRTEAENAIGRAREYLGDIEASERVAENKKYVGKFYRRRNNYSGPKAASDYWWVYTAVTAIDKDGFLQGWQFEKDSYGKIEIRVAAERIYPQIFLINNISKTAFDRAFDKLITEAKALKAARVIVTRG